jgi:hypothetical protein
VISLWREGEIVVGVVRRANNKIVDRDEVDRLRKRFMKLDKVRLPPFYRCSLSTSSKSLYPIPVYTAPRVRQALAPPTIP